MSSGFVPAGATLLGDRVLPEVRYRNAVLVTGGVMLVALAAQVRIPLWFTPVPITGQTFGVAVVAAGLGASRGALALTLYVLLGAAGMPFYAGGQGGLEHAAGSTAGYLAGFVPAAWLIGALAERGVDRSPWKVFLAFQAGSLVIFACGVAWLSLSLGLGAAEGARLGWIPFIPGDLIKTALAAGLFPTAWLIADRYSRP